MSRAILIAGACLVACLAGILLGLFGCGSVAFRDRLGIAFGRGHILAMAQGQGIYQKDVESEIARTLYVGDDEEEVKRAAEVKRFALSKLVAATTARELAKNVETASARIDHAADLVRDQFRDARTWSSALVSNHLTPGVLRSEIAAGMGAESWLEHEFKTEAQSGSDESHGYFNAHPECFVLPERLRASHLFLAAPTETPAPIIELKGRTIDSLSVRLSHGEDFAGLVSQTSEDEASKKTGGDIGFFSRARMPEDFISAVAKMPLQELSPPFQTGLGFHIVRVTDRRPERRMTFEEAEPEILLKLEHERRLRLANRLAEKWLAEATYVRPGL